MTAASRPAVIATLLALSTAPAVAAGPGLYERVPANVYDVRVVPAGAGPEAALVEMDLNLFYGADLTVVAIHEAGEPGVLVLEDDNSAPADRRARVRFLHAAPDAPAVDLKVQDGPFLFQDVSFKALGGYVAVPGDEYRLELRVAGTDTVALELTGVSFREGGVYTLLATGLLADDTLNLRVAADTGDVGVSPTPPLVERPLLGVQVGTEDGTRDPRR